MSVPAPQPLSVDADDAPANGGALVAVRPGAIILTRHGEPALSRKCMISARQYGDWWGQYEVGGLRAGQTPPQALIDTAAGAGAIYASTRPRALETAAAVVGEKAVMKDALFIEAPLPPPFLPDWIKLSPRWWGVVSRIWWRLSDRHHSQETHREARVRAEQAAQVLIGRAASGQNVLVLAHGYFNHMVGKRLKANGWALVQNQGFKYWSQRRYERVD